MSEEHREDSEACKACFSRTPAPHIEEVQLGTLTANMATTAGIVL